MKQFLGAAAAFATLTAAEVALAINAMAVPLGGSPVEDAIRTLEAEGYTVQINQTVNVPLSRCTVTNVSGLRGTEDAGTLRDPSRSNVAFLDISCTH